MDLDNKIKAATLVVLIIGALGVAGTVIMTDKYQHLNTKYNDLVEWENSAYGHVFYVQDIDEINAAAFIGKKMEDLPPFYNGSWYMACPSKSGEAGKIGICFYNPKAHYRNK